MISRPSLTLKTIRPCRDHDGLPDADDPRPNAPTWTPRASTDVPLLYLVASPPALTPPGVPSAADHLVRLLDAAQSTVKVQLPHLDPERCIGCGTCQYRCPVGAKAAIRVSSVVPTDV